MKKFVFCLALIANLTYAGPSTVNPDIPAANSALQSAPIRTNFAAAANDINGLIGLNNGTSPPVSPVLGQWWLNTTASPYVLNVWDGTTWDPIGTLRPSGGPWAVPIAQGGTGLTAAGSVGCVLTSTGSAWVCTQPTNTGTVTSVGLILPGALFNVTGSPVTTSGTLAASLQTQAVSSFFAGPSSGGNAQPSFRAITAADIPTLNQNTTGTASNVTGTVAAANGGTGLTTCSTNGYVLTWSTGSSTWTCAPSAAGGTVTSVGLSLPLSIFSVSGSPITGSGTLTGTLNTEPANFVWAGPTTGTATSPSFRALVGSDLPAPGASTFGGVFSSAAGANQFATGINTSGALTYAQPSFSNLSGSSTCAQEPAYTGDITTPAGSCATTLATVNSNVGSFTYASLTVNAKGLITAASNGVAPLSVLTGYINGFALSNDGTSPNTVLDIAAGYAADSASTVMITGAAWKKSISGTFSAGSGNNGMGTGLTATASTWYHVFAIVCSGSFDIYFDTSFSAANAPACATKNRYIGDIFLNASTNIRTFFQNGQKIVNGSPTAELSGGSATSVTAIVLNVPPDITVFPILKVQYSQATIGSADGLNIASGLQSAIADCYFAAMVASVQGGGQCETTTNTSRQIFYNFGITGGSATITSVGYVNPYLSSNK